MLKGENRKVYDVIFYYPQHFNRSNDCSNPFFNPLIKICQDFNFKYLVIEEPDKNTNKPHNKNAYNFTFWFTFITFFRKLLLLFTKRNIEKSDRFIGSLIKYSTNGKFRARNYITISNSMVNVLLGINKNSRVFDLQHGVISKMNLGYFTKNGNLRQDILHPNIHFLLYGEGFASEFYNEYNEKYLISQRINIIGDILNIDQPSISNKNKHFNKIVYSLQFTIDWPQNLLEFQKEQLINLLESVENVFIDNKLTLYLKHHPRYNQVINLDPIKRKFSFVEFTEIDIHELINETFIHITQMSTTAFEFARFGIPTYFIYSNEIPEGRTLYIDHFSYPCIYNSLAEMIYIYLNKREIFNSDSKKVIEWYKRFYKPFKANMFLSALDLVENAI